MGFLDRLVGRSRPAGLFSGGLRLRSSNPPDPQLPGGPPPGPARPLDAWRDLPPMPRTLQAPPATVQAAAFEAGLASRHAPAFLGTLGHRLDAAAPAGTVLGLATPAATRASEGQEDGAPAGRPAPGLDASRGGDASSVLLASPATPLLTAPAPDLPSLSLPPLAVGSEPGAPAAPDRTALEGPPAARGGPPADATVVDPGGAAPAGASPDGPDTGAALLGERPVQRALGPEPAALQPPSGAAAVLPAAAPERGTVPAGPDAHPARRVGLGPPVPGGTVQRATAAPPSSHRASPAARQSPPTAQAWPSAGPARPSAGRAAQGVSAPPGGEIWPSIRQGTSPFGEVSPPGGQAAPPRGSATSPPGVRVARLAGQPSRAQGQAQALGGDRRQVPSGGSDERSETQVSRSTGQGSPPEPRGWADRGADPLEGAATDAASTSEPAAAAGPSPGAARMVRPPPAAAPSPAPGQARPQRGAERADATEVLPVLGERTGRPAAGRPAVQRVADGPPRKAVPSGLGSEAGRGGTADTMPAGSGPSGAAASAEAVTGWQQPGGAAPVAPLLGERPVVLASLLAIDALPPTEVRHQAPGEPAGPAAAAAEPGRAGLRGARPGASLAATPAHRGGPPGNGPPGGHPHPTGVRLPGGPPAPPTGPVAQRAASPAPTGAVPDPAALALASGLATPDGSGGLRFASPAAGPTVQLAGVAADLSERFSAAASGAAEQLGGAAPGPANALAAANGRIDQLGGAATGVVRSAAAAAPARAAPPVGAAAADLDDLARRLYDRLRSRLMAELRLDRERAGLVTDLRH